jgi:hypothetical protein
MTTEIMPNIYFGWQKPTWNLRSSLSYIAKLRKATISFVMPVRPSVRVSAWNNSAPSGLIFNKVDIWVFFENIRDISSLIKIEQEWRVLYMKINTLFWSYLPLLFLAKMKNISDRIKKIETQLVGSITFFSKNRLVFEIIWNCYFERGGSK